MNKSKFIKQHLIAKGVPASLTADGSSFWYRFVYSEGKEGKPLVFQSPIKVLIRSFFIYSSVWGVCMWFMAWRLTPEYWPIYLTTTMINGFLIGGLQFFLVSKAQKKLGTTRWENWYQENYVPLNIAVSATE
ncbi:DUF6404 family protein [Aliivibrio fischeri]|uniref:Uncharacterized protein n=1 Tax=Aliivibrio fischeri TaxID=668 RepID=A0A510UP22_ALIFS|nr:DUF6404 family protein [Aliivibrio fischeri]GEK16216.1 hypothetical protein AFI02nite_42520 [Aliivibrio fischeri]